MAMCFARFNRRLSKAHHANSHGLARNLAVALTFIGKLVENVFKKRLFWSFSPRQTLHAVQNTTENVRVTTIAVVAVVAVLRYRLGNGVLFIHYFSRHMDARKQDSWRLQPAFGDHSFFITRSKSRARTPAC